MRGDARSMKVLRPASAGEALRLLARHPKAVPLAGGTDFMVSWNLGAENGKAVLDLSRLRSWRAIRATDTGLRFGALATHWQIQNHPVVARRLPLLASACATVGGRQIQTRGTLGGNVANASPAGDTFPPLAVYEARVRLRSESGRRVVPFHEIFAGVKRTTLAEGELIASIDVDFPRRGARQLFRKVGTRAASAISKVVVAGLLWRDRAGRIEELRFAVGSVATTVRRLGAAERFIAGKRPTRRVVEEAASLVENDIAPIDDLRSTAAYRLTVARNLLRRFLLD